jgi:hypothetical protein
MGVPVVGRLCLHLMNFDSHNGPMFQFKGSFPRKVSACELHAFRWRKP